MSSKGKIDEVIDIPAVKKQIDYLKTELDTINSKFGSFASTYSTLNKDIKGASGMIDLNRALKEQAILQERVIKLEKEKKTVSEQIAAEALRYEHLMNGGAAAERELLKVKLQRVAREKELLAQAKEAINSGNKQVKSVDEQIAAAKRQVNSIRAIEEETKKLQQIKKDIILVEGKESAQIKEVNAMIDKNTAILRQNGDEATKQRMNIGNYESAIGGVKKMAGMAVAAIGGMTGAISFGKSVIESSEALSDKWAKTTTGLTFAWDSFKTSIAKADFSNLLSNMRQAIEAGEKYADIMDELEDRRRGATVSEAKAQKDLSELRIKMNDVNLTAKGRAAYAQQIIDKEQELARVREGISKTDLEASTDALVAKKNISKAELQAFIEYKGTTEEKVKLAGEYNETQRWYQNYLSTGIRTGLDGNILKEKEHSKLLVSVQETMANTSNEVKSMGNVLKSISPKEIEALTEKTVEYFDAQANVSQVVENTMKKQDKLEKTGISSIDKQITAYEKLTQSVADLKKKELDMYAEGKTPSEVFYQNLWAQEQKIKDIGEQAEKTGRKIIAMHMGDVTSLSARGTTPKVISDKNKDGVIPTPDRFFDKRETASGLDAASLVNDADIAKKDTALELSQITADATFDIIRNNDQAILDGKLADLETQKNAELANKNLTEAQKAAIEEKYAKKTAKLKTDAAKKEKAASIIQAIINTAIAVSKANTVVPPGNIAAMILAAAAGAAQIAVIAAQPLPKYAKGRDGGKAEFAWVGEQGTEAIVMPGGNTMLTPDRATMTFLPAGASVIPNKDLMSMTENISFSKMARFDLNSYELKQLRDEVAGLHDGFKMLASVVKNKTEHHVNITERGIWASSTRGASETKWINDNIRF